MPEISGPQARYLIERFLKERRISRRDVEQGLSALRSELSDVEARLRELRGEQPRRASAPTRGGWRRRENLSPARRAQLQLQGIYLALMRQTPKSKRPGFTALFKSEGAEAAIAALKQELGK